MTCENIAVYQKRLSEQSGRRYHVGDADCEKSSKRRSGNLRQLGQYRDHSDYDVVHLFNLTRISETYAYFCRAMALYCNPCEEADIPAKVEAGLTRNRQPRLKAHILKHFCLGYCMEHLYLSYYSLHNR